jgi:hypothetical protein
VGVRAACAASMAGTAALGACWHAWPCPVVLSRACKPAGEVRGEAERRVGSGYFSSLIPGLMAGFWAGKMGHRQQEGLGGS